MFSQFKNTQKKAALWLRNLQKNIQKATIAPVQVTDNLLQDKGETKAMIKNNLDAISLMGHSLQDISTTRCQKGVLKPSYPEEGDFISPIFVTPKSDGGYRLILNLESQ